MRLDKFLANLKIGSRKEVKSLIRNGKISVNDKVVTIDNFKINPEIDRVFLENEEVFYKKYYYFLMNKPSGYICANKDNLHKTVFDLDDRLSLYDCHTVGRLDKDTTGVLLLTNNGKLSHNLISPKKEIEKVYIVKTIFPLKQEYVLKIKHGLTLNDGYKCKCATFEIIDEFTGRLTLTEGKFHQVKRMFIALNNEVVSLHRERFHTLTCENLPTGKTRQLTVEEEKSLYS